jgi:hypothetical protein
MPVATPTTRLVSGLAGAIGSSFRQAHDDLIFVEWGGKLSRLQLVRPVAATVSSGTATIHGTWTFDFETGVEGASGGDVWWEQHTATVRSLEVQNGARIVNLGHVAYTSVTPAVLQSLAYGTAGIVGNDDSSNQLVVGDVFAVLTNAGNYAKAQVLAYGYDLQIKWTTYRLASGYTVLGTGWNEPEDVVVTADEAHAYVTERTGDLVRVSLSAANRASGTVVCSGLTAPQQLALDETHNQAYVVEFANPGRLLRIDLPTGTATPIVTGLENPIGLLVDDGPDFAYVTEQLAGGHGQISRIELATGRKDVLFTGSDAPLFFMRWTDDGQSAFLVTERDPSNELWLVDLTQTPPAVTKLATGTANRPSSAAVVSADTVLLCCDAEIDELAVGASALYHATGDIALGIGHVPATTISGGYATTDPGYFFQVKDAPFGGSLPLMVNHDKAWASGAHYYKVLLDGVELHAPFSDYKWNSGLARFDLVTVAPTASHFYKVRSPAELWFNHFLGGFVDSTAVADGLHTIEVKIYASASAASEIGHGTDPGRQIQVMVDNTWPIATIDSIQHDGSPVGTCAIVDSGSSKFGFGITATDSGKHLLSWRLTALWGDDKSAVVAADDYSAHVSPSKEWYGTTGVDVPAGDWDAAVSGDASSTHCAHTFYLDVWDRVIDGWSYVHESTYHRSITIMLP